MTALNDYQKLESTGVWRAAPDDQRRDVFVSVGDATLVIYDTAGRALAHWSLPAVVRTNPGHRPALYAPGADAPEELEITDDTLRDAIERVRHVIDRRRPREGRLRLVLLGGGLAAVIALGVLWLPDALTRHAASVVPDVTRAELGNRLLANIRRVAGRPCETLNGRRALDRLYRRLLGDRPGRIVVLSDGVTQSTHLPGGLIVINRALVEDFEDPDVAAGYVLAEALRSDHADAVHEMLSEAGPRSAFQLLTTGEIPEETLAIYAETLMTRDPAPVPDEALLAAFAETGTTSTPYAYAIDISGESTLGLIEADPARGGETLPVLPDSAWVSLQGICGE